MGAEEPVDRMTRQEEDRDEGGAEAGNREPEKAVAGVWARAKGRGLLLTRRR